MESNSLASAVAELSVDQKPDEQAKENNDGGKLEFFGF